MSPGCSARREAALHREEVVTYRSPPLRANGDINSPNENCNEAAQEVEALRKVVLLEARHSNHQVDMRVSGLFP